MIKFFRRIRQNLLSEGKTGKYFKYAIGEVVLVVIGILIALQINNWNENKKSLKKTDALLTQVHKELAFNIDKANRTINFYRNKDSLIYKVLNKKLTYKDYESHYKYSTVLRGSREVNIVNDAFTTLTENQNEFILPQEVIIKKLRHLYGTDKREVDLMDEYTANSLFSKIQALQKEGWIYDNHVRQTVSHEQITYYLTSPDYLGEVTEYKIRSLIDHAGFTLTFRNNAIEAYNELSDYLGIKKDSTIIKNVIEYEHYIGIYEGHDSNFTNEIKRQDEHLIWTWKHKTDSTRFGEIRFYPDTKTYFTISDSRFGKLTYDANNDVSGLIISRGEERLVFMKVK